MDKQIVKLIEYQVKEGISEKSLCKAIGITPVTLYSLKHGNNTHEYTRQQINKFINGLQRESGSSET